MEGDALRALVGERAQRQRELASAHEHRLELQFFASVVSTPLVMFIVSRTTAFIALRPSSKMFVIAWRCALLGCWRPRRLYAQGELRSGPFVHPYYQDAIKNARLHVPRDANVAGAGPFRTATP
eukprot:5234316-Pleurochrysis_carterae.AAC.5